MATTGPHNEHSFHQQANNGDVREQHGDRCWPTNFTVNGAIKSMLSGRNFPRDNAYDTSATSGNTHAQFY